MTVRKNTSPGFGVIGKPMMLVEVAVGTATEVGLVEGRNRRCIPITGGTVTGQFEGVIVPGGADWQTILPDGTIEVHARYVLELIQGKVEVESRGLRHGSADILARLNSGEAVNPDLYYFRTAIRFRTAAPELASLNRVLAISHGERRSDRVHLTVYEVA